MRHVWLATALFVGACGSHGPGNAGPTGNEVPPDAAGNDFDPADAGPDAPGDSEPTYLWRSTAWSNGNPRDWKGHGAFDPDDPALELAAGEGRHLWIDGAGVAKLDGNRSRIYIHVDHRDIEMVFEANATDTALENISTKQRSRHGEGGDSENRFGGYGVAFDLKSQSADFKIESYHNEHESGREHALPRDLEYNHWYRYKVSIESKDNDTIAVVKGFIDYDMTGEWTLIGTEEYDRSEGNRMNDLDAKYTWIRANSGDEVQEGLLLRNVHVAELAPPLE
ncbi:MAG: hypothetical protein AB7P03_18940 [Kofleriaceae bacterium]